MNDTYINELRVVRLSMASDGDELLKTYMDLNSLYTGDENNDKFAIEHSERWKVIFEIDEIILSSSK